MDVKATLLQTGRVTVTVSDGSISYTMRFRDVDQMAELAMLLTAEAARIVKLVPRQPRYVEKSIFG